MIIISSCDNNNEEILSRVVNLEVAKDTFQYQVDSLENELKYIHGTIDSLLVTKQIESKTESKVESRPKLELAMFIGKSMKYISDFWATKISTEYFNESEKSFSVMVESVGMPDFIALFGSNGLCNEHTAKIGYSDISVMQARLMKAGYKHDKSCNCWKLSGVNHVWKIEGPYGTYYQFTCSKK